MTGPRLADLATKLLRRHAGGGAHDLGDRSATVAAIERALQARSRRRRPLRVVGMALLAGAAAAAAIGVVALRRSSVSEATVTAKLTSGDATTCERAGLRADCQPGQPVLAGDRLRTGRATTLGLSSGTRVDLAARSDLEVLELGGHQRLALRAGTLRAQVTKLRAGESFSVATAQALVSVRGTDFEVAVAPDEACGGRPATHVRVFEGVVVVEHESGQARLLPAQSWTSDCTVAVPPPAPAAPAVTNAGPRRAPRTPVITAPAGPGSTLPEQNHLFAQALVARREGDLATARKHLDELLARFPSGPLAAAAARARQDLSAPTP
jgi:ferric-dicitrate binding protein FerR (iron transport regulator)